MWHHLCRKEIEKNCTWAELCNGSREKYGLYRLQGEIKVLPGRILSVGDRCTMHDCDVGSEESKVTEALQPMSGRVCPQSHTVCSPHTLTGWWLGHKILFKFMKCVSGLKALLHLCIFLLFHANWSQCPGYFALFGLLLKLSNKLCLSGTPDATLTLNPKYLSYVSIW